MNILMHSRIIRWIVTITLRNEIIPVNLVDGSMFASLGILNNCITYEKFYNTFTHRVFIIDEHKVTECLQLLLWFVPIFCSAVSNDIPEIMFHELNLSHKSGSIKNYLRRNNYIYSPPSVVITCPVTYALNSEARKRQTFAMSSPVPNLPKGMLALYLSALSPSFK